MADVHLPSVVLQETQTRFYRFAEIWICKSGQNPRIVEVPFIADLADKHGFATKEPGPSDDFPSLLQKEIVHKIMCHWSVVRMAPTPTDILDFGEALAQIESRFCTITRRVKLNCLQYWTEKCPNKSEIERMWIDVPTTMAELCTSSIVLQSHLPYIYIHHTPRCKSPAHITVS